MKPDHIIQQAISELAAIMALNDLDEWKRRYLGRQGQVTRMLKGIGNLPADERAAFGRRVNDIHSELKRQLTARETSLQEAQYKASLTEMIDITLPGRSRRVGGLHLLTQTVRQISRIMATMGFQVYRSRDVESDDLNFTLLNFPPHHPARDMWDTFYTTQPGIILRTHTSPGQIHAMRELGSGGTFPIRVILPGQVYRFEQITSRANIQFLNIEGLAIGRSICMSDLKGVIAEFARVLFGSQIAIRFRASYFPFTEPSMEVDVGCTVCSGQGCSICKQTGWLEILGCGMVHPVVLRNGGYDPAEWSGFAFGMGAERIIMMKHRISDIRYFTDNDLRFLKQF